MSKKNKIMTISFMLVVFSILFIEVILPIFEIEHLNDLIPKDFAAVIPFIGISFSLLVISFGSSFLFVECFVREKTILSGRPMTGLFSLCTVLSIIIASHFGDFCAQSTHTIICVVLGLFFLVGLIVMPVAVVLISKAVCFFMRQKGYDKSSIIVYLIIGTIISSINYSFLIFSAGKGGNEGGPFHVLFGAFLTIIVLIANAKTIMKMKKGGK